MGNVQASITTPAFITRSVADYASEEHEKTTSACDYLPHRDESNPAVYITKVYWYTPDGRRWCVSTARGRVASAALSHPQLGEPAPRDNTPNTPR